MSKITSNPEKHYLAVKVSGDTDKDVLRATAAELFAEGYVKESYSDAIIEREEKYPTGLPTGEICVAIPHTDPEHVNDAAICLSILEKPVTFNVMGAEGETTEASMLFMLAVKRKEDQMDTLMKLINVCQDQEMLKQLLACDVDRINEVMTSLMDE